MKRKNTYKIILLILLPFIIGFLINSLVGLGITRDNQLLLSISTILLSIWTYGGAIIFWFMAGRIFANLNMNTVKSFAIGNSGWAISLLLFVWQFLFVNGRNRNLLIAGISQHYALGFVGLGSRILGLFTNSIHSTTVILIAYFVMLIVFSIGFISKYQSKE